MTTQVIRLNAIIQNQREELRHLQFVLGEAKRKAPHYDEIVEALREIARRDRAPEFEPTDAERAKYWADMSVNLRNVASKALALIEAQAPSYRLGTFKSGHSQEPDPARGALSDLVAYFDTPEPLEPELCQLIDNACDVLAKIGGGQ